MTASVTDVYELNLATSGKLALRAKGRLAEGTPHDVFEACVLLHEAARHQHKATEALLTCPPTTRLASSTQECWCLVEGRDPPAAANAWGRVLRDRQAVDVAAADAMVSRLGPRFERSKEEFSSAIARSPMLLAMRDAASFGAATTAERSTARAELARLLASFPGATSFWWMDYRLAEMNGEKKDAWFALERARLLAPDNPRFKAMSLLVAVWALPRVKAEAHVASARTSLEDSGAEVCLMYAVAEINLARSAPKAKEKEARWKRARDAAGAGIAQATTLGVRANLRAVQLVVEELLAGREPTLQVFYVAGLGETASTAKASADVILLLTTRLRREAAPAALGAA